MNQLFNPLLSRNPRRAEMRRGKLVSSVMYRAGADELSYIISRFPNELQARLFPVLPFVELRRPSYIDRVFLSLLIMLTSNFGVVHRLLSIFRP